MRRLRGCHYVSAGFWCPLCFFHFLGMERFFLLHGLFLWEWTSLRKLPERGFTFGFGAEFHDIIVPNADFKNIGRLDDGCGWKVRSIVFHDANVFQSPLKSFLDHMVTFRASLSSSNFLEQEIGFVYFGWRMKRETDMNLSLFYRRPPSTFALFIAFSIIISLLSPDTYPFLSK